MLFVFIHHVYLYNNTPISIHLVNVAVPVDVSAYSYVSVMVWML